MSTYSTFFNSTLGKKIQIAFSGIALCIFLLFHLMNNLTLLIGPDVFNGMVKSLEAIKPLIRILELGLLIILITHVFNAIYLTAYNNKASSDKYEINIDKTSTKSSRTMIISGIIILSFFIIHLRYFWYTYQIHDFFIDETYFDVIMRNQIGYLGHLPTAVFYIIAITLIGAHLKHGFQSALKTFGVLENSKWGILYKLSILFWAIIPALFILIIILIQFNYITSSYWMGS